jgi:hypothetical protein
MSAAHDFLLRESRNIEITIELIETLLQRETISTYEMISLGTLLQNVYMGIENILRHQICSRKIPLPKTESWHQDLLLKGHELDLVTEIELPIFKILLLYRHRHIHGYGHLLDEPRLRELAAPVPAVVRGFLDRVKSE